MSRKFNDKLFDGDIRFTPLTEEEKQREDSHIISQAHFSCKNCGSDLVYSPTSQDLVCRSCGIHYPINTKEEPIREYDFNAAINELARLKKTSNNGSFKSNELNLIQCPSCGAEFSFKQYEHAGDCPYCGTPIISGTESSRFILPRSLLPFKFGKKDAIGIYDKWVASRWFAPSALKNNSNRDEKLIGIYLPYWTYDSQTYNRYQGLRGVTYYDRQVYSTTENGRRVQRVRMVPRIRWSPVSGQVNLHFDDVLIGATKTLPRTIVDNLQPWDLENLVPYSEEYISGFHSEIYQVTVDQGFLQAENIMERKIYKSVRYDIGGDQQRISSVNTQHQDTSFKHVLLPVWSAAFKYRGKTYRYVINGRNGAIQGERPYSFIKIGFAVLAAVAVLLAALFVMESQGTFNQRSNQANGQPSNYNAPHLRRFNNDFRIERPTTPKRRLPRTNNYY